MGKGIGVALITAVVGVSGGHASAQDDPAYPAATCAALWAAHARSPLGPGEDPLGFRNEAVRLSGDPEAVDAFIATQTMRLTDLIYAYIDLADSQSRELFEALLETCERFAERTPQIATPQPPAAEAPAAEPSG